MGWTTEVVPAAEPAAVLHTAAAGHGTTWALGITASDGRPFDTLAIRRDAAGWQSVEVPVIGRANRAVVCSPTEVWIVGDGTSLHGVGDDWRVVPTADGRDQLFGLVAFGSTLWTAGSLNRADGTGAGAVQRWDGARWTEVPLPPLGRLWSLAGLGGVAEDDLWAVGAIHTTTGLPVALHWDGDGWQPAPVPLPGNGSGTLKEVLALASDDVWASGYWRRGDVRDRFPLVVHWDGAAWSVTPVPDGPGQPHELTVVDGRPHVIGHADGTPYVLAWDGAAWQRVEGPSMPADAGHCFLHGATTLPDGRLLVVGAVHLSQGGVRPYAAVRED